MNTGKIVAFTKLSLLLTAFPLCAQQTPSIEDLHWLLGTWAVEITANAYEAWEIANDSTLHYPMNFLIPADIGLSHPACTFVLSMI